MKFGAPLSPELREKYRRRTVRVREGDSVRIVRGEYKDIEGKVTKVIPSEGRITVEGVTHEKIKGGTSPVSIDASNVVVTALVLEDKTRKAKLEVQA